MRKASVDENGVKKGAWTEEEDEKLRSYILRYGHWNWRLLPKFAGLARCGKSCRLRWVNYLKPGLKRGSFTKEEERLVAKLHDELGKKWSAIAARIPGRTDNEIKNFWHTHLKKRSKKIPSPSQLSLSPCKKDVNDSEAREFCGNSPTSGGHILESSGTPDTPNPAAVMWDSEEGDSCSHVGENLFSEEQVTVIAENYNGGGIEVSLNDENYEGGSSFWSEPFLVDTDTSYGQDRSFPPLMEEEAEIYLFTLDNESMHCHISGNDLVSW